MPNSPLLFGPNNVATNLQAGTLQADGGLLKYNGNKNYLSFGNFENNNVTGWSLGTVGTLTNAIPTGTPTFGSGAAGTLTATITSTAIEGAYSLSYADSAAATTVGNMLASQAYTIDTEDQAKVLTWKFYYSVPSGASNGNFSGTSSNSFGVAIYDVTNSSWLSSTANFGMTQSSGAGIATGTCQTNATTASLRFVVYNANATTAAVSLTLDGFYLGPQTAPIGFPGSANQSYTLTIGAVTTPPTPGTNTSSATWERIGGYAHIVYTFAQTGAGSAGSGTYLFPLPAGLVLDTTRATVSTAADGAGGTVLGAGVTANTNAASTSTAADSVMIAYNTTNLAMYFTGGTSGQMLPVSATAQQLSGTTVYYSFNVMVPISGWSSNVQMSSDTLTQVVAGSYQDASGSTITAGSTVQFATTVFDTSAAFSSGRYQCPVSGYYQVNLQLYSSTANQTAFGVYVNAVLKANGFGDGSAGGPAFANATLKCNAGDYIDVRNSAGYSQALASTATYNVLSIQRLSGPSVVAATESVNGSYNTTSSTITSTLAAITFTNKLFDSHNAYSGSTYTAPVSGKYQVNAMVTLSGTLVLNSKLNVDIYKNGASVFDSQWVSGGAITNAVSVPLSHVVSCNAGDTIQIYAASNGSSPVIGGGATNNIFSIARVGN